MLNTENELKKNECEDTMRKWVRICPQCNNTISYNYKSIADKLLKTNPPCKSCLNKNKKGVLKKPRINVFCKLCGKLRYVLTSEKEKEKRDFSLCKSCAQKGRISNRKGKKMPLSAKIELSKRLSGKNHPQFGKPLSSEHKRKIRTSLVETLKNKYNISPNYNKIACHYFNNLMKNKNIKIRHAENGREFYIKELGYWVDGYDEINNTVYEWYEKHHFNADEKMREKDIKRINEIKEFLKCRFVGYNWDGDIIIDEY